MDYKFDYPLSLEEIKDLAYDLRDGKITYDEREAILKKNREWYERSKNNGMKGVKIMDKIDIVSDNYFNEEFNTSDIVKVFKDVYKKGFRRGVEKQKEVNNSTTNMNLYKVSAEEFDYLDGFRHAIVWARDELHAERLVRVKYDDLPKKKRLLVKKIELEDDKELIISDNWIYV